MEGPAGQDSRVGGVEGGFCWSLDHNLLLETVSRVGYIFPSENPIYINKRRRYDTNLKHESAQQQSMVSAGENFKALQSCAEEF